jgi:hypothetical protein
LDPGIWDVISKLRFRNPYPYDVRTSRIDIVRILIVSGMVGVVDGFVTFHHG